MPTIPKKANSITAKNSANVLNSIKNEVGGTYADMIPYAISEGDIMANGARATREDAVRSLRAIGNVMLEYQPLQNAFLSALINRIAQVVVTSRLYENPWSGFKRGVLEYGETIEEIFVQIATPYQYDPIKAETEVFKRRIPDVKSAFHSMNYQKYYPTTVSREQLHQAFLSYEGVSDLINRIIEQIYTGANYDEFIVMKYMIAREALNGDIYSVNIEAPTADNARSITSQMVTYAKNLGFMSTKFNAAGVNTYSDITSLYMILTTEISSIFDVEVLALSFNMNKAELLGRQIYVDGFGTFDNDRLALIFADDPYTTFTPFTEGEMTELSNIQGLMVDKDWFMIYDNLYNTTEIYNPQGLYWNYFYHVWKTFSTSPFSNAILFTTSTPGVTSVTVTPGSQTIQKGQSAKFSAAVVTTGLAPKNVKWKLTGTETVTSTVDETGTVTIASDEANTTLTLTATSVFDDEKTGTATITVGS